MNSRLRQISASGIGALALIVLNSAAQAQSTAAPHYPSKPIRMIVPFAPGGGVDLIGRTVSQKLGEAFAQTVVVDNRGGAGGNSGTDMVAKSVPDGYTLLTGYIGNLVINPWLFRKLPYDPVRDFAPITLAATAPNILVAHPSVTASNVRDLVALAKAKPGQLNYASGGNGTVGHMAAELLKTVTGIDLVHIPYKGNGPAMTDLIAGQVQLIFSAPGAVLPHVRADRLKSIAIASRTRVPNMPEVPTFIESGYADIDASGWYGILAPAGTPAALIARLNKEIVRGLEIAEVKERLANAGYDVATSTPEQFATLIKVDLVKWAKVVKASGARVD